MQIGYECIDTEPKVAFPAENLEDYLKSLVSSMKGSYHFYNTRWTEDPQRPISYVHHEHPKAPLHSSYLMHSQKNVQSSGMSSTLAYSI